MTKGQKKRDRSNRKRGLFDGNHKAYPIFVLERFNYLFDKNKHEIPQLKNIKHEQDYPAVTRWLRSFKQAIRSINIIKLGFIENFGFKDGKIQVKGLAKNNKHLQSFQNYVRGLQIKEINRQRAQNRQILGFIHPKAIRCYFTKQNQIGVGLKRHSRQKIKGGKKNVELCIQKLESFYQELISGKIETDGNEIEDEIEIENQNESQSERDSYYVSEIPVGPFKVYDSNFIVIVMDPYESKIHADDSDADVQESSEMQRDDNQNQVLKIPSQILSMQRESVTNVNQISNLSNKNITKYLPSLLSEDQCNLIFNSIEKKEEKSPKILNQTNINLIQKIKIKTKTINQIDVFDSEYIEEDLVSDL